MDMTAVNQFLAHLSEEGTSLLQPIVAVGVLTMSMIQTTKDLLPVRRWFQRRYVGRWLTARVHAIGTTPTNMATTPEVPSRYRPTVADAEHTLLHLATAGSSAAFYDLPIEQLCGQVNAAARVALDYPRRHRDLLMCLAADADPWDVRRLVDEWEALEPKATGAAAAARAELVNARNRVTNQVQRSIDGLQIAAGARWKMWLQTASFVLSFIVTALAAASGATPWPAASAVLYGLAGGFLAPVARDLLAAVQSLRR